VKCGIVIQHLKNANLEHSPALVALELMNKTFHHTKFVMTFLHELQNVVVTIIMTMVTFVASLLSCGLFSFTHSHQSL
jgi:hypothetical protein